MRPVKIGQKPATVFKEYGEARTPLIERIGNYCIFCERRIPTSLAVEHKRPKSLPQYAHLELEWLNFLVGCTNCNGTKGTTDTGSKRYLFPDECNTAYAFVYAQDNHIRLHPNLSDEEREAAQRTLQMVGLDRLDLHLGPQSRWHQRARLWEKAKRRRALVEEANTEKSWQDILDIAEESGFWSVWMAVFQDHPQVRQLLIDNFPGTNKAYFHLTSTLPQLQL